MINEFKPAKHFTLGRKGHSIEGIVLHYTAGGSGRALAKWLASDDPSVKVSAHYVVCRDGHIIQQVSECNTAWHAGTRPGRGDRWNNRDPSVNVNLLTVGIELANYGKLKNEGSGVYSTPYGKRYKGPSPVIKNGYAWEPYTLAQINATNRLIQDIVDRHNIPLASIVGHSSVSPNRKSDPGPAFSFAALSRYLSTFSEEEHYSFDDEVCLLEKIRESGE